MCGVALRLCKDTSFPPGIFVQFIGGFFKFGFIKRSVAAGTVLTRFEEFILTAKYRIREAIGSQAHWYGLDTSPLIVESVPLSAPRRQSRSAKPRLIQ